MPALCDLTNHKFGRLTVISRAPSRSGHTYWMCRCDCGKESTVNAHNLGHRDPRRRIQSCGCYGLERKREAATTHGLSKTPEFLLWCQAKRRAQRFGWAFDLDVTDVTIPPICPLLGIPLYRVPGKLTAHSPSIDRIEPALGYVKGNIQVISHRANAIKSDASFEEFERVYLNWKASKP